MKQKEYICVLCPKSCSITVSARGEEIIEIDGYQCDRGKEWAIHETIRPRRYFVGSVSVKNGDFETVSVKSSDFVPLELITRLGLHTHSLTLEAPIKMHEVLERNVLDLEGVDLIATREVHRRD